VIENLHTLVTIYPSPLQNSHLQGVDPNKLVVNTDTLSVSGPTPPSGESFTTLRTANNLEVLRGVSWTPGF
jgi:hypothetical protein